MSRDVMSFPSDWWTFVQQYQFADKDEVYTNGSMLIPSFRVRQMVEHYFGGEVGKTSRYAELFGTPERAARTLETIADNLYSSTWSDDNATLSDVMCALVGKCDECAAQGLPGRGVTTKCGEVDYDALLEWLRGDA